jgi:hypothetical protein
MPWVVRTTGWGALVRMAQSVLVLPLSAINMFLFSINLTDLFFWMQK